MGQRFYLANRPSAPGVDLLTGIQRREVVRSEPGCPNGLRTFGADEFTARYWTGKIDDVDVLMTGLDVFQLDPGGEDQLARPVHRQPSSADQLDAHPRFFLDLARRGVIGQLVRFNVASRRQPTAQLGVEQQQHPTLVDDEDRHGEVANRLVKHHGLVA